MTPLQVVGLGMEGLQGLSPALQTLVQNAAGWVGSDRHLSHLSTLQALQNETGLRIPLSNLREAIAQIRQWVEHSDPLKPENYLVILTSGDPLFFGLGRLLLAELPAEWLTFHPHVSSMQLAFSRIKVPWQGAELVSAHGRSPDQLIKVIQQQQDKIAVLTDGTHPPPAIAQLVLQVGHSYQLWVCEALGSSEERVRLFSAADLAGRSADQFSPLNVVILIRQALPVSVETLPQVGIADGWFASFSDRPNLMTKREVRVLVLAELALQDRQVVWDIGAGTGSVAIEIARLCPQSQVYAVEKTAAGVSLINQNITGFKVKNVQSVYGTAPEALSQLPDPDRIFIGGSGGALEAILDIAQQRLRPQGVMVLAIATLEHLSRAIAWIQDHQELWRTQFLQVQLSRSATVGSLTRFSPLNPVTLIQISAGDRALESSKSRKP
jgi:precorrin-6Y C5,15-methyltransferase (decarboxylating)